MLYLCDILGTLLFCISGAMAARQVKMDYFGMFILALVTGAGGGTLRAILIGDTPPPILRDPVYLMMAVLGVVLVALFERFWENRRRVVSFFDAFGIGLFVCIGVQAAQDKDLAWWAAIGMGVITATFGGVIRDIIRNEVPLILRKEIYATACAIGALLYLVQELFGVHEGVNILITTITVASIRLLAIRYALNHSEG